MELWHTKPSWHNEERYDFIPLDHKVNLRLPFKIVKRHVFVELESDLYEYYDWAEENCIEMCHSILRYGNVDYRTTRTINAIGLVGFAFPDQTHAMAFKLRWK
jgi:hypothetical protein